MWPFKKKPNLIPIGKTQPITITIDSNDTPRERAVKMCQAMNMVINQNMYNRLDDMARVFEYYQIVDTKAAKGEE
jgi:ribosomal protein S26